MTGIYFSGTGNSKYALDLFLKEFHAQENIFSIEEAAAVSSIKRHKAILFSYPVQFSNIPKSQGFCNSKCRTVEREKSVCNRYHGAV